MSIDPRTYRNIVGLFATGVMVIAIEVEGQIHAMTANSFTSLSLDPMLLLFCVAKKARMAVLIEQASGFSVNILRHEQQALSTYFAGGWKESLPPAFRFVAWAGGPRLEGCAAAIGCTKSQVIEGGDHWIVVGAVVAIQQGIEPRLPLLYFCGKYHQLAATVAAPAPNLDIAEASVHIFYDPW
jgi:flavin reductase (DIM6/NTAB) family NADH-FMN oxidoreductase RutF